MRGMFTSAFCMLAVVVAAETISVPLGETKVVNARRFESGMIVKDGPGELVLKGAKFANDGLEIREGTVKVMPLDRCGNEPISLTARYLRFNVTKTRPGKSAPPEYANSGSQFSEFRLYHKGKMLDLSQAVAMNQDAAGNKKEGPAMGIDGNLKTKCYFNPLIVDLGREMTFDGYSYVTANDAIGRDPISWKLEAGTAKGSRINWMFVGTVENFNPPIERFAEVGKVFLLVVSGLIPFDYPIMVKGKGKLVITEDACLGKCTGDGLIQLDGASLVLDGDSSFSGSVVGGGNVTFVK